MALITHYPLNENHIDLVIKKDNSQIINGDGNNLSIITLFTDNDKAILASQLDANNIGYINAAENIESFVKAFKPCYYKDALEKVKSEYALLMDAYDTKVNGFEGIRDIPSYYGKKIIYSAWKYHFPTFFNVDFGVGEENPLKYINSGVVFGRTEDLLAFYRVLSDYIKQNYEKDDCYVKDFEQYWIYKFLSENKEIAKTVGIDYDSKLVETM